MDDKKNSIALLSIALGLWLISISLTLGYKSHPVGLSDILSGLFIVIFGLFSFSSKHRWPQWGIGIVGIWLQMAPLFFWAPEPLMYVNDTLIGAIAIVLSFLFNKNEKTMADHSLPTGWSYNPSGWEHRLPTVFFAMLCWFFSRYMAAFQLGYIDQVWDPFFSQGTLKVITSKISEEFPVSDAGLGALCYSLEFLLGWQGGAQRWRQMPWLVFAFAFLVIPVGIVSVILIVLQPVVVGAWCSWCLATAAFMLLMIILTAGELAAVLQFLKEARLKGNSLWQAFWKGESVESATYSSCNESFKKNSLGVTFPWNLVLTAILGIWLMFSPSILNLHGSLAINNYIEGPMIVSCSVIAFAEVFRSLRYINILLGAVLVIIHWVFLGSPTPGIVNNTVIGILVIALSFRKGKISERYGVWSKLIF